MRKLPWPRQVCAFSLTTKLNAINFTLRPFYPNRAESLLSLWTRFNCGNTDLIAWVANVFAWDPRNLGRLLVTEHFQQKHTYSNGENLFRNTRNCVCNNRSNVGIWWDETVPRGPQGSCFTQMTNKAPPPPPHPVMKSRNEAPHRKYSQYKNILCTRIHSRESIMEHVFPLYRSGCSVPIQGHLICDFWWTKRNRYRFFSEHFLRISLSVKFHHISNSCPFLLYHRSNVV